MLHKLWSNIRRGWYDYTSIPVTMVAYLSIIEYLVLSLFPPLKNLLSGSALLTASLLIFLAISYWFGSRERRLEGLRESKKRRRTGDDW